MRVQLTRGKDMEELKVLERSGATQVVLNDGGLSCGKQPASDHADVERHRLCLQNAPSVSIMHVSMTHATPGATGLKCR